MQLINKNETINYFKETLKFDDTTAQIYAYKVNQTLVSALYMIPAIIIAVITHTIDLWLIALLAGKLMRKNIGGIHIKNSLMCFILSFMIIEASVWITYFIGINQITAIILAVIDLFIWLRYVPKGTAQMPLRSKKKIAKMKISSGIFLVGTFLFKFWLGKKYCDIIVIANSLMLLSVLPISYKVFKVSYDRNL